LYAAYAKLGVDDGRRIRLKPHLAGSQRVVDGDGRIADMGVDIRVRGLVGAWHALPCDERKHRGLGRNLAGKPDAGPERLPVSLGRQELLSNPRMSARILGLQRHSSTTLRMQHYNPTGEAVGERC